MLSWLILIVIIQPCICGNPPECWNKEDRKNRGSGYRGTQSETTTGLSCLNWSDPANPYSKEAPYFSDGRIGNHNYCRNPSERYWEVWCYTSSTKWQWCTVPTCKKYEIEHETDTNKYDDSNSDNSGLQ